MTEKTKSQLIRESNISTYTSMLSKEDLLIKMFQNSAVVEDKQFGEELKKNKSLATKFSQLLESITLEPITTQQLLKTFYEEAENEEDIKCIEKMGSFVKIVHAEDYKLLEKPKKINNKNYKNLSDTTFVIKKETLTKSPQQLDAQLNKQAQNTYYKYKHTYGIHADASNSGKLFDMETLSGGKASSRQSHFVNRLDSDNNLLETRLNTSLSFIMIDNPNLRVGTKNSLELNTFFNTLSTIELSKCIPFFDVQFILPSLVETKGSNSYRTASVTQFLSGTPYSKKPENLPVTNTFGSLSANFARNIETKGTTLRQEAVATNMAAFTMPQTVNNFDEKYVGHLDNIGEGGDAGFKRQNSIHDYTRPFMTIKNFSVDIAPTQGLMSFKTGKISLVLHDRTRMSEIAPFIKPDLFGSFGAEIVVTYGWSHIDGMDSNSENFLGKFLDKSKVREKYIITNSTFNIDSNGQVNIDLSIAMRGPIDIRSQTIKSSAANKIKEDNVKTASLSYRSQLENIRTTTNNDLTIDLSPFTDLIQSEIRTYKGKKDLQKNLQLISFSGSPETIKKFKAGISQLKSNTAIKSTDIVKVLDILYHVNNTNIAGNYQLIRVVLDTKFEENSTANINSTNSPYNKVYSTQGSQGSFTDVSLKSKIITLLESLAFYLEECYNSYVINKIEEEQRIGKVTESIIGNLSGRDVIDPFFNKDWIKEFYKSLNYSSLEEQKQFARRGYIPTNNNVIGGVEYVTFGKFISSVIGSHMSCNGKFDEIQILSYTANDSAGLMSNLNLASFLIPVEELKNFIENMFTSGGEMTLEGIFVQVINRFIMTSKQLCYGFSHLYKRENNVVKQVEEDSVVHRTNYNNRLRDIYNSLAGKNIPLSSTEQSIKNVEFIMPRIKLSFDTLVVGQKTICRISILDQNDNPYKSSSALLKAADEKSLFENTALLNKLRNDLEHKVKTQPTEAAAARLAYFKESQALIAKLETMNLIERVKETIKDVNNKDVTIEYHKISSLDSLNNIKSIVKETMPSITYGTQNSAIIDASVTTVNESRLNAVYLTRADRNADKRNNEAFIKFTEDMPLRVMPQQANITIFGCPFVNFAQYIFLDFETGTTVDNQYAITGVKHDFSPGKFTTSLTLSYGDIYGKYENVVDSLSKTLEEQREANFKKLESDAKKEEERNKKNEKLKANSSSAQNSTASSNPVSNPPSVSQTRPAVVRTSPQSSSSTPPLSPYMPPQQTAPAPYVPVNPASPAVRAQPAQPAQPAPAITQVQQNQPLDDNSANSFNAITQDIIDKINDPNNEMIPSKMLSKEVRKALIDFKKLLKLKVYKHNINRGANQLLPLAHEILGKITEEARQAGFKGKQFPLSSGYRSFARQETLFEREVKINKEKMKKEIVFQNKEKLARGEVTKEQLFQQLDLKFEPIFLSYPDVTLPGSSHHNTGYAMDVRIDPKINIKAENEAAMKATKQWKWLQNKSYYAQYLSFRVKHEPWHWEFPISKQIEYVKAEKGLSGEELSKVISELIELENKTMKFLAQLRAANNLYRVKLLAQLNPDTLLMKDKVTFKVNKQGKEVRRVIKSKRYLGTLKRHKKWAFNPKNAAKYTRQINTPNSIKTKKIRKRKIKPVPKKINKVVLTSLKKLNLNLKNHNFISSKIIELGKIKKYDDEITYNRHNIEFTSEYEFLNNQNVDYNKLEVKAFANDQNVAYFAQSIKKEERKGIIYVGVKQDSEVLVNMSINQSYISASPDIIQSGYLRSLTLLHINDEVSLLDRNFKYFKLKDSITIDMFKNYLEALKTYRGLKSFKNLTLYNEVHELSGNSTPDLRMTFDSGEGEEEGLNLDMNDERMNTSNSSSGSGNDPFEVNMQSIAEAKNAFELFGQNSNLYFCMPRWFKPIMNTGANDAPLIFKVNEPIFDIEIFHLWKGELPKSLIDPEFNKTYLKRQKFILLINQILFSKNINISINKKIKITDFSIKNAKANLTKIPPQSLTKIKDLFKECLNPKFVKKLTENNNFVNLETSDLKLLNTKNISRVRKISFDDKGLTTEYIKKGSVKSVNGNLKFETEYFTYTYLEILKSMTLTFDGFNKKM
tara:strand:+ start:143 stop:6385 length:6243 start_codon:yes stop_codon:yes gene_type:complete